MKTPRHTHNKWSEVLCVGACEKQLPPSSQGAQEAQDNTEASCRVQLQTGPSAAPCLWAARKIRSTTYPPGQIFITRGSCSSMTQIPQFPQEVRFMIGQPWRSVTSRLGSVWENVEPKTPKNSGKLAAGQSASMWPAGKPADCSDGWKRERHSKREGFRGCEQVRTDTRFPVCLCRGPCGFQGPAAEHKYITSESHITLQKDKPGPAHYPQIEFKDLCPRRRSTGPFDPLSGPFAERRGASELNQTGWLIDLGKCRNRGIHHFRPEKTTLASLKLTKFRPHDWNRCAKWPKWWSNTFFEIRVCKCGPVFWPEGKRAVNPSNQWLLKSGIKGGLIITYSGLNLHLIQLVLMGNQVSSSSYKDSVLATGKQKFLSFVLS